MVEQKLLDQITEILDQDSTAHFQIDKQYGNFRVTLFLQGHWHGDGQGDSLAKAFEDWFRQDEEDAP